MDLITTHEFERYMRGTGSPLSNVDPQWTSGRITAWSAALAQYCGRLDWGTNGVTVTEYYDGGNIDLQLHQLPVKSVCDVNVDGDWSWATSTIQDSSDYHTDLTFGILTRPSGTWYNSPHAIRVRYYGGYTAVSDVPDILKEACYIQCAHAWRRLRTAPASEYGAPSPGAIMPEVKQLLAPWRIVAV